MEWINGHIPYEVKKKVWDAYGYKPWCKPQENFHRSTATHRFLAGGNRSGKSYAAAQEVIPYLLYPNTHGWIVVKNYSVAKGVIDHIKRTLTEKLGHLFVKSSVGLSFSQAHWHEKDHRLTMWNGSTLEVKSADNPDALHAVPLHYIVIDEASLFPYELYDTRLTPRLADYGGWIAAVGTFEMFQGSWFQDYVELGLTENDQGIAAWCMPTEGNPHIDQKWLEEQKRRMDPDVYAARFLAVPAPNPFLVFPRFSTITHTDAEVCEFDPDLPVYLAVDPGGTYAVAALQIKTWETEQGAVTGIALIDEVYYTTTVATPDVIAEVMERPWFKNVGLGDIYGVIDVAAKEQQLMWSQAGIPLVSKKVGVLAGIDTMNHYIVTNTFKMHPRCANAAEEFSRYSWPEHMKEGREKRPRQPRDEWNHLIKAIIYFIVIKFGYYVPEVPPDAKRKKKSIRRRLWGGKRFGMR